MNAWGAPLATTAATHISIDIPSDDVRPYVLAHALSIVLVCSKQLLAYYAIPVASSWLALVYWI
jgi:hypothetical protein